MIDKTKIHWPTVALAILFVADGAGFGTWAAHIAVFKQHLHLANGTLTCVLLSVILGALISMPFTGQSISRYGSKTVVRFTAMIYAGTLGLMAFASNFFSLLICAGLFGASKGGFDVSNNSQAFAVQEHSGKSSQGLFQGCWSLGGLIGAEISSLLLRSGGTVRTDLSLTALCIFIVVVAFMPFLVAEKAPPSEDTRFVWPDAPILRIALITFFGLLSEGAISDWAAVYLHTTIRVSLSLAAAGYAAFSVTMTLSRFANDWLTRTFSDRHILQGSGLFIAGGMGICLVYPVLWSAMLGLVVAGIGVANIVPVTLNLVGKNSSMETGPAVSALSSIGYCGFLAGPPIIGSLAVAFGLREALYVLVLAGVVIIAGASLATRPSPDNTKAVEAH